VATPLSLSEPKEVAPRSAFKAPVNLGMSWKAYVWRARSVSVIASISSETRCGIGSDASSHGDEGGGADEPREDPASRRSAKFIARGWS
jgi:hypothetical protein